MILRQSSEIKQFVNRKQVKHIFLQRINFILQQNFVWGIHARFNEFSIFSSRLKNKFCQTQKNIIDGDEYFYSTESILETEVSHCQLRRIWWMRNQFKAQFMQFCHCYGRCVGWPVILEEDNFLRDYLGSFFFSSFFKRFNSAA